MTMPATLPPPSPCKEVVIFSEPKEYSPGLQLYWASCARSLPDMAEALAHGEEVNWVNTDDDKRTPLIMAVQGVRWMDRILEYCGQNQIKCICHIHMVSRC